MAGSVTQHSLRFAFRYGLIIKGPFFFRNRDAQALETKRYTVYRTTSPSLMVLKKIFKKPRRKNSWLARLLRGQTESVTPPESHLDTCSNPPSKGQVIELNSDNWKHIVGDPERDVVVEFYDARVLIINSFPNLEESRLQYRSQDL